MRFAFLGGTGYIGYPAVKEAIETGHEVMVIHRGTHSNLHEGVRDEIAARSETDKLQKLFEEWSFLGKMANDSIIETSKIRKNLGFKEKDPFEKRLKDLVDDRLTHQVTEK